MAMGVVQHLAARRERGLASWPNLEFGQGWLFREEPEPRSYLAACVELLDGGRYLTEPAADLVVAGEPPVDT